MQNTPVKYRFSSIESYKENMKETLNDILKGKYFIITEKLDGANIQIERVGNKLIAGSREWILTPELDLSGAYDYVQNLNVNSFKEGYIYFGEWLVGHKLNYGDANLTIRLFAVAKSDKETEHLTFLDYRTTIELIEATGLKRTPVLFKGIFDDSFEFIKTYVGKTETVQSKNKPEGEGIVVYFYEPETLEPFVRSDGKPNIIKFVSQQYLEYKKRPNVVPLESSLIDDFIQRTVLPARIEKVLFKNQDLNIFPKDYTMRDAKTILPILNKEVWEDVLKEEGQEFNELLEEEIQRLYKENVDSSLLLTEEKVVKQVNKNIKQLISAKVLYIFKLYSK